METTPLTTYHFLLFAWYWFNAVILFVVCLFLVVGNKSSYDECSSKYRFAMEKARIVEPEKSPTYCNILWAYRQCQDAIMISCRDDPTFYTIEWLTRGLEREFCPRSRDHSKSSPEQFFKRKTCTKTFSFPTPIGSRTRTPEIQKQGAIVTPLRR